MIRLSWADIETACRIVSRKILKSNYKPELCLAISRGGLIPARLICDLLDLNDLTCWKVEYYAGVDKTLTEPRILHPPNADPQNKRVLVVDDVADRGNTLILAKKNLQEIGARETRIAALHFKPWSKVKPDYYARELRSWIVYPWEVAETIRSVTSDLVQKGLSADEAKRRLTRIGITQKEIRSASMTNPHQPSNKG